VIYLRDAYSHNHECSDLSISFAIVDAKSDTSGKARSVLGRVLDLKRAFCFVSIP